jgi:hypothetical protein
LGERSTRGAGRRLLAVAAGFGLLIVSSVSAASVLPQPISSDPYTNTSSQHKTQLEPDTFGFGNTVVATFQVGRFYNGGASNIGWATSQDSGRTWTTGMLPGTTVYEGGTWARISDPAVAYDPLHNVWMISGLAINASVSGAAVTTSRSTDGGLTWQNPVNVAVAPGTFFDKNWITCDTWAASPHYGNCYTEWDDAGIGGQIQMSTSTDGGLTWGPVRVPPVSSGLAGQPVVQPNGTVIVPYNSSNIRAFRSTDGGNTWTSAVTVASDIEHNVNGGLRGGGLISAEIDGAGKVYLVWQDCRFRSGCSSNDIVMTTSTDGITWSAVQRVPIDATTSTVDHFIPGIGVDRSTSGSTARLALAYYYYPVSACSASTCQLTVGFISSLDGGATWSAPRKASQAMNLSWIASSSQGRMVGDYISTSFAGGTAHPVFAIAKPPIGSVFKEQAATATFDVTSAPRVARTVRDKQVFTPRKRLHSRLRTAN